LEFVLEFELSLPRSFGRPINIYTSQHQNNLILEERQIATLQNMTLNSRYGVTRTGLLEMK
jgi:hypothetical protein